MSQSAVLFGALILMFFVFVWLRGDLGKWGQVWFGPVSKGQVSLLDPIKRAIATTVAGPLGNVVGTGVN